MTTLDQLDVMYGPLRSCPLSLGVAERSAHLSHCDFLGDIVKEVVKEPVYYIQKRGEFYSREADPVASASSSHLLRLLLGSGLTLGAEEDLALYTSRLRNTVPDKNSFIVEVGPRLNHKTPWCTNVLSVCENAGITLERIERFWLYHITLSDGATRELGLDVVRTQIMSALVDELVEQCYSAPIASFSPAPSPKAPLWNTIPIVGEDDPADALKQYSDREGLGFDSQDLAFYSRLYKHDLRRNPTDVELTDLAQSNSEHSRHWFFTGRYIVDGKPLPISLMKMVKHTQQASSNKNNVIAFHDNSSAIKGFTVPDLCPLDATVSSSLVVRPREKHLLLTAETHNFPTAVEPFSGAGTGTGGRLRDVMAAGRGAFVGTSIVGYSVGQLHLSGDSLPWETQSNYNGAFQKPQQIIIEGSNGASDYGNKFGEPVIGGYFRSYGAVVGNERREYLKPIMFTVGIGFLDGRHVDKETELLKEEVSVAKIGGPAYRIGIGGGQASSTVVQGSDLEQNAKILQAVQRGDPEMGNKLNRLVRACVDLGDRNPILSIHDQGAGGNANVLKEIVDGHGADIFASKFSLGDKTLSLRELWCAEYQESNAILVRKEDEAILQKISTRERCSVDIVGRINSSKTFKFTHLEDGKHQVDTEVPVSFPIQTVTGKMEPKTYMWERETTILPELNVGSDSIKESLMRILRLASVGSKRFLTSKVDRSVSGLVAQQQCVGPLHIPLADVSVTACSYFDKTGVATAIGEQPIVMLVSPESGSRLSLMEALASLLPAPITSLQDVKCSVNWMWPAKMQGEGLKMYDACQGLCELMERVGVAIDGGKDSLSMAVQTFTPDGKSEVVKAPGTVVVSAYVGVTDINKLVTPDMKGPSRNIPTRLLHVRPISHCKGSVPNRLGGSAFAYTNGQLGNMVPDFSSDDAAMFVKVFPELQLLIQEGMVLSCHDVSEGGLVTCALEMCLAGNCGAVIDASVSQNEGISLREYLFAEEIGWVIEVGASVCQQVIRRLSEKTSVYVVDIGAPTAKNLFSITENAGFNLECDVNDLRKVWEETSHRLERLQTEESCVNQEYSELLNPPSPKPYEIAFEYKSVDVARLYDSPSVGPSVAVLREEGTNGDREMAAAFLMAGFHVTDLTMTDLLSGKADVSAFRGLAFPGGFSYADALGAGVGWAASISGNALLRQQLQLWFQRKDTFSLAICNGCQLTALLGWQEPAGSATTPKVRYLQNNSLRFESRWSRVRIPATNSIMLGGMAGSVLGVWTAHGEGRFACDDATLLSLKAANRVALQYVDCEHKVTQAYPHNPNGSPDGIAGTVSACGRHLAMMPHPERCFMPYQWPYAGADPTAIRSPVTGTDVATAPWAAMFQNAYDWCSQN